MKITPVTGPGAIQSQGTPEAQRTAKAVAAFNRGVSSHDKAPTPEVVAPTTGNAQAEAVANPNQVSAEELSAIQPKLVDVVETIDKNTETEGTEETKTPETDPAVSEQFAKLAKNERNWRAKVAQQESAFKAREAELATREAALTTKDQQYKTGYVSLEDIKSNSLAVLAKAGVSYDQLAEQILTQQPANPQMDAMVAELKAEIAELRKGNETVQSKWAEQQEASYKAAVRQIGTNVNSLVASEPEKYEAIAKTNSQAQVTKLIEDTYAKDGVLLSEEEAANEVEEWLVEQSYKTVSQIDKIKKRLAMASAQTPATTTQKTDASKQQPQQMKTLTNATSGARKLSARERALLAFKGELKD